MIVMSIKKYFQLIPESRLKGRGTLEYQSRRGILRYWCWRCGNWHGADLLIIDDPHSEQEGQSADPAVFDKVYEWYTSGPRQRLQPGGAIIIVMTRWHKRDLTGKIIKTSVQRAGMDEWELIEFPAIMPSGKALWPEFWALEELEALRSELPAPKWNAQYQQDPSSEEGALVNRNGGRSGKMNDLLPVSLLSSLGTRHSENTEI